MSFDRRPLLRLMAFAEKQHSVFGRPDARRHGVSSKVLSSAVRRGSLQQPQPGVYRIPGSQATWEQRLMISVIAGSRLCLVSRRAAAALHPFDGFRDGIVEITTNQHRYTRPPGTIVHTTSLWLPEDSAVVRGIPCTDPVRTIIDLGDHLGVDRLEEVLDAAERDGLVDRAALTERLDLLRVQGRSGVRHTAEVLRRRLDTARAPTNALERAFLRLLEQAGVELPDCQVPVKRADGRVAVVDFLWIALMFGVEIDGHGAHSTRRQRASDNLRQSMLALRDIEIVRFTREQVLDEGASVAAQLRRHLVRRRRLIDSGLVTPRPVEVVGWHNRRRSRA